jgi:hypothetical protein
MTPHGIPSGAHDPDPGDELTPEVTTGENTPTAAVPEQATGTAAVAAPLALGESDVNAPRWAVLIFAAILLVVSAVGLFESRKYSLGTLSHPGSAIYPIVTFAVLGLASLAGLIRSVIAWRGDAALAAVAERPKMTRVAAVVLGAVLYAIFLQTLGDVVAGFLICCVGAWAGRPRRWWLAPISAAVLTLGVHELFVAVLQVPLPRGLWPY